jgi:hypothetical protein
MVGFGKRTEELLRGLSDLAARCLLLSHRTRVSRDHAVERLGLRLEYPRTADADDYALAFLAILALMALNFLVLRPETNVGTTVVRILMISLAYLIAVVAATARTKQGLVEDAPPFRERPWRWYLARSVLGGVGGWALCVPFLLWLGQGDNAAVLQSLPWALMLTMVTLALAYVADGPSGSNVRRLAEGVVTGCVAVITGWIVREWLRSIGAERVPPETFLAFAFALGAFLGVFVRRRYVLEGTALEKDAVSQPSPTDAHHQTVPA